MGVMNGRQSMTSQYGSVSAFHGSFGSWLLGSCGLKSTHPRPSNGLLSQTDPYRADHLVDYSTVPRVELRLRKESSCPQRCRTGRSAISRCLRSTSVVRPTSTPRCSVGGSGSAVTVAPHSTTQPAK